MLIKTELARMADLSTDTIKKMLNKNKKDLLLIHGAWSSCTTFNFLKEKLNKHKNLGEIYHGDYDINSTNVDDIILHCNKIIDMAERNIIVVAHSMGGLIALNFDHHPKVDSIITVSSPLSGLTINRFVQMLLAYRSPNMADIFSMSNFVSNIHNKEYTKPIQCVVTTEGFNPAWYEKSDGVVTVNSQKRWVPSTATLHHLEYNHHEVLQSHELYEIVKDAIEK